MAYSKAQLEVLWATTNPGNGDPHLMAAIALAESAGKATALNSIGACGLWQIHPYEAGCLSPTTNARMAGEKLKSQGLTAWETYTNGAYKQYYTGTEDAGFIPGIPSGAGPLGPLEVPLQLGREALEGNIPNPVAPLEEGVNKAKDGLGLLGGLGNIPNDFDKIYKLLFTPEGWVRIGKVLVGLFLLLMGVTGMANVNPPPIVQTGKKVAEVAGVAAVA